MSALSNSYRSLSCNTIDNPQSRICVSNKKEDVNLKVFDMIKGINESKKLSKDTSYECKCEFDGRKYKSRQKHDNGKGQCKCKKLILHRTYQEF